MMPRSRPPGRTPKRGWGRLGGLWLPTSVSTKRRLTVDANICSMGRANQPHAQFNEMILTEDFNAAMRIARRYELILDLRQSLDLTILAGKSRKPIYDPMAVRWIKITDDRGKLKLGEVLRLAQMMTMTATTSRSRTSSAARTAMW
jgi:hypothetical protein